MTLLPSADPLVILSMRAFKANLLSLEAAQMREMARRWMGVELALQGNVQALADEAARIVESGEALTPARIFRMDRANQLLAQAQVEFNQYADYSDGLITQQQNIFGDLGIKNAQRAIQASYFPRVGIDFNRLPVEAVLNMVGIAGNGQPLGELLKLRMVRDAAGNPLPDVWPRLTQTLIDSTALGRNPRETARLMMDDLTGGLNKALVIARTEQLRVYRQMSADQYRESGVVVGQRRLSAHDNDVCPACIADEGTLYPLGQPIPDHPQGRCTGVPVVKNLSPVKWQSGEAWFSQQNEDTQLSILGPGRLDAWQSGAFAFKDLVVHTHSTEWGGGLQPTPLKDLL